MCCPHTLWNRVRFKAGILKTVLPLIKSNLCTEISKQKKSSVTPPATPPILRGKGENQLSTVTLKLLPQGPRGTLSPNSSADSLMVPECVFVTLVLSSYPRSFGIEGCELSCARNKSGSSARATSGLLTSESSL